MESIAVLSRGRSFRTSQPSELTGPRDKSFSLFAEVLTETEKVSRVGLERSGTHWRGRLDGNDVKQLSHLTRLMPIVLLEPDSHLLVSGPPEVRRKYLDWGLFHVEHGFLDLWRRYSKALKQRNAALRQGRADILESLDSVLAEYGNQLGLLRKKQVDLISERIGNMLEQMKTRVGLVEIEYQYGWNTVSYMDSLIKQRETDLERGMTTTGPHRADIKLVCDSFSAKTVLSRGEQKAFSAALLLTQLDLLKDAGVFPVFLVDDLESEFDEEHFETVLEMAIKTGVQIWLTGTGKSNLKYDCKVFHVEQGVVSEMV